MTIKTDFSDFEPMWNRDVLVRKLIPPQINLSSVDVDAMDAIEGFNKAATPTTVLSAFVNWVLSGSL